MGVEEGHGMYIFSEEESLVDSFGVIWVNDEGFVEWRRVDFWEF